MLYKDTDRLWISDMRVQKLILDTLNGKTPLASNKKLTESLKALSDAFGVAIESLADAISLLADAVTELSELNIGDRLDTLEAIDAEDRLADLESIDAGTRLTALETFKDTTVPNTYCTKSDYDALEERVRALEQAQPT